jgi:putative ATP-dependent endonuclease of the OLD family
MRIQKLHVVGFRSIFDETLECEPLTALIGRNGAGKSTFLQALRLFLDPNATAVTDDYYNRDDKKEILIDVTFSDLTHEERNEFRSNLDSDFLLVVQRKFPSREYYGLAIGCPEFEFLREKIRKKVNVSELSEDLAKLVESGNFPGLHPAKKQIENELVRWEKENPDKCKKYFRSGIFQGPTNIAGGTLRARTHFVYIPPVREAELDASGSSKQSPLGALVAPLVNAVTEKNETVANAKRSLAEGYNAYKSLILTAPEKKTLESQLTELLQRYDAESGAKIQLSLEDTLNLPAPKPKVLLVEDGYEGDVSRKGHGLQRLFIFTILELYEKFRTEGAIVDGTIVLAIEEPELYQHPTRARALARILRELTRPEKGVGLQFQIFITTHSPYFVDLEAFESLRRVEKMTRTDGPMETRIRFASLKKVGASLLKAYTKEGDATELSTWARLKSVLGVQASEGFFADAVILVEGQEDEAILTAYAEYRGVSLDGQGVAIIPSDGKTNIPNLLALYTELGIRTFVLFDGDANQTNDKEAHTDTNKALLFLLEQEPKARPETHIFETGAVWKECFCDTIKSEFGISLWHESYNRACDEFSFKPDEARKKFAVIHRTVELILKSGKHSLSLDHLWLAITKRCGIK